MGARCAHVLRAALVFAGAVGTTVASAAPPTADPVTAEALFRDAREQMGAGNYAAACPKFAESERLDPAVGTVLNLAQCEEHILELASAWENWHKALDELPPGDARLAIAREHLAALEPRLPRLTLRLAAGAPSDTHVVRDTVELGPASFGVAVPADPGDHVLRIEAAGHAPAEKRVHLDESQALTVEVEPGPVVAEPVLAPSALAPPPNAPETGSTTLRTAGWIVASVGVASFVGAAITGGVIVHDHATASDDCTPVCHGAGASAVSGGKSLLALNAVAWAVGVAGVAGGTVLIVLGRAHTHEGSPSAARLSVSFDPGRVSLGGAF